MTRIVSIWLPAWPIERLRRQKPASVPDDRAFALVETGSHGIRITAANDCALTNGVRVGSSLADARAVLPALVARPAQPGRDRVALFALARWCGRYGPARHVQGDDGIWIDIMGVAHLFGGEAKLLADLLNRFAGFGITARAGLADTFGAAFSLARFAAADKAFVIARGGEAKRALADHPVAGLRLDADTVRLLHRLGLKRIGQLYDLPRAALARRFRTVKAKGAGKAGQVTAVLLRLDQALGTAAEPYVPLVEPADFNARLTLPEPLISAESVEKAVAYLAQELARRLADAGRGARHMTLSLYRVDSTRAEICIGTSASCRDPRHISCLLEEKLQTIDAGFGIDGITLAATTVERLDERQTNLDHSSAEGTATSLEMLIDKLANRLGSNRVSKFALNESYIPERAQSLVPALSCLRVEAPVVRAFPRRPPFLLSPPEPVTVIAEVPEGAPAIVKWRKVERRIVRAEGPERIACEWWCAIGRMNRESSDMNARTRDYYHLEDATGARYWVFRQGLYDGSDEPAPRWFVHGLFA